MQNCTFDRPWNWLYHFGKSADQKMPNLPWSCFRLARQNGWGDKDFAAVIEPLREIALSKHTKD